MTISYRNYLAIAPNQLPFRQDKAIAVPDRNTGAAPSPCGRKPFELTISYKNYLAIAPNQLPFRQDKAIAVPDRNTGAAPSPCGRGLG